MLTDYVNMEHMKNAYRTFNNLSKFLWQQINAWKQGKQAIIYSWWFIYVRCPLVAFLREKKKSWESVFCKMSKQILCTIKIDNIWAPLYYSDSVGRARKFCAHGPIFLQKIPIPVQAQKIWAWTGIIFDFVFQDHLKGNFLNSQQPMIVCEVSWFNFL